MRYANYSSNGVKLSKKIVRKGSTIELSYNGLLVECGADNIYAHFGFNKKWDHKEDILMEKSGDTFKAELGINYEGILNITFRDNADNWDNNSGENYSYKIYKQLTPRKKSKKSGNY